MRGERHGERLSAAGRSGNSPRSPAASLRNSSPASMRNWSAGGVQPTCPAVADEELGRSARIRELGSAAKARLGDVQLLGRSTEVQLLGDARK